MAMRTWAAVSRDLAMVPLGEAFQRILSPIRQSQTQTIYDIKISPEYGLSNTVSRMILYGIVRT